MDRFSLYQNLLSTSSFFKLVCGAGNENPDDVKKLAFIYTLAGCKGFDVSASPEVVRACKEGISHAFSFPNPFYRDENIVPFITVSVGMPGDHHVRKALIEPDKCVNCDLCIPSCPTDAIPKSLVIIDQLCIGCGNCESVCPPAASAISYKHNYKELSSVLPLCVEAGAESIELHAGVPDHNITMKEWNIVSESIPNGMISMCLDRYHLSNNDVIDRIKLARDVADDRLIIQADGIPMSGGTDDFNTTLQAISIADIINKSLKSVDRKFRNLPILISGGTNSLTGQLARQCSVDFSGITIGTHARKIVKNSFDDIDFENESLSLLNSVSKAYHLISTNLNLFSHVS